MKHEGAEEDTRGELDGGDSRRAARAYGIGSVVGGARFRHGSSHKTSGSTRRFITTDYRACDECADFFQFAVQTVVSVRLEHQNLTPIETVSEPEEERTVEIRNRDPSSARLLQMIERRMRDQSEQMARVEAARRQEQKACHVRLALINKFRAELESATTDTAWATTRTKAGQRAGQQFRIYSTNEGHASVVIQRSYCT